MRFVADELDGVEADEAGAAAHFVEAIGFESRADGAGFAAMFVDDDIGLDAFVAEA